MLVSLSFVHLYCLKECLSLASDFFVLDRYHLVEIDSLSFFPFLKWTLLITKPTCSTTKRFHVISSAELKVQRLQFILDLGIVRTGARIESLILWYSIHDISLDWRNEGAHHVLFVYTNRRAYRLQDSLLLLMGHFVLLVRVGRWHLCTRRICERLYRNISTNQAISLC